MKDKIKKVFEALGWKKSAKELNYDEQKTFAAKYAELFNSDLITDFGAEKENAEKANQLKAVMEVLGEDDTEDAGNGEGESPKETTSAPKAVANLKKEKEDLAKENKDKDEKIKKLGSVMENDDPKVIVLGVGTFAHAHSKTHLFGISNDFFSLEKRWNRIMVNPKLDALSAIDDDKVFTAFQNETKAYGAGLAKRMQELNAHGMLPKNVADFERLLKEDSFTQTYTTLAAAGGDQFLVLRQDALIARIQALPNVFDIFPRRFGVQDREIMTNAFLGEFSQAYQSGEVWKGSMELVPEVGYVDDAMFKTKFEGMKWLERQYIGYLNKEGSDPMKWSLIEWTLLQIATKLNYEAYSRRIMGIFVKPVAAAAGHYLHASTGYAYTLLRYIHEGKLQPFTEAAFVSYDDTGTSMVDFVEAFYAKIKAVNPDLIENEFVMLLNGNHKHWYRSQLRSKYSLQSDFVGIKEEKIQDTDMRIQWVPNMKQLKLVCVTKPGNFQALENLPGEMFNIQFQPDMEAYKSWSTWKEGFSAEFVGKKFATPAALLANAFALQEVFMNKPVTDLAADATTADATANFWFRTVANTGATVLTDFTGAVGGVAYILENGSTSDDTTINNTGKFDQLGSAYTPSAVGDYWMGVYDTASSKFFELERCVAGTRTVNTDKQPNIPGGR